MDKTRNRNVHKNTSSDSELHDKYHSESHTSLRVVIKSPSVPSAITVRFAWYSVQVICPYEYSRKYLSVAWYLAQERPYFSHGRKKKNTFTSVPITPYDIYSILIKPSNTTKNVSLLSLLLSRTTCFGPLSDHHQVFKS